MNPDIQIYTNTDCCFATFCASCFLHSDSNHQELQQSRLWRELWGLADIDKWEEPVVKGADDIDNKLWESRSDASALAAEFREPKAGYRQ
jgi:hypothetical protein